MFRKLLASRTIDEANIIENPLAMYVRMYVKVETLFCFLTVFNNVFICLSFLFFVETNVNYFIEIKKSLNKFV